MQMLQEWECQNLRNGIDKERDPIVYKLDDLKGEDLLGIFYETELAKVTKENGK